ncbi:MAG: hypothetical protein HGB12_01410 [Bacteroidetes bacterium]|nr:hypothetical protein [Bacteroidota bacterium]
MENNKTYKISKSIVYVLLSFNFILSTFYSLAQSGGVAINATGNAADNSAMLDVNATNQGMLIPRMTTIQRDSIPYKCSCTPAQGLQIFNTTTNCFEFYLGTKWQSTVCGCTSAPAAAGSISGTATVCPGQNAVLYSVSAISGATSYIWSYSGTGAVIVGSTNTVIVYFSGTATSGNLTVMGANACGNGNVSDNYAISVNSTAPNITIQPASMAACLGNGAVSFTVTATGGLTYQWQEYISSWNNVANAGVYSNVTTATLTITNPPLGMNGNKYRCIVSGTCTSSTSDGIATLTVDTAPEITSQPTNPATVCSGTGTPSFTVAATGAGLTYKWQEYISSWNDVSNGGVYSNATTATLTITNPTSGMNAYKYRCIVNGTCAPADTSDGNATLSVNAVPEITSEPSNPAAVCSGTGTPSFTVTATGLGLTYQWQEYISSWNDVSNGGVYSNVTTATLTITNPASGMNGYKYRCIVSGTCSPAATSDGLALLTVDPTSVGGTVASNQTVCSGSSPADLTLSGNTGSVIRWEKAADSGFTSPTTIAVTSTTLAGSTIGNLTADTYFRAVVKSGSCSLVYSSTATITISPLPVAPGSANVDVNNFCANAGGNIILTATGGSGTSLKWYTASCGGSIAGTGNPLTIAKPTTTTTYYARWETASCGNSSCASVTVTVISYASGSQTFNYTGAQQTFTVPSCVTSITIDASGASGNSTNTGAYGGKGARVQTTLSVTSGSTLYIYVGGSGVTHSGYNGGNDGGNGYSGGGASDIRQSGTSLTNRIVVAGGGGAGTDCAALGSCTTPTGGNGGQNGSDGTTNPGNGGSPGGGATQSSGGNAGTGNGRNGSAGSLGVGGYPGGNGGAGGGGYYGGGGGAGSAYPNPGAGGGGGSSYSAGSSTSYTSGYQTGDGQIIINY